MLMIIYCYYTNDDVLTKNKINRKKRIYEIEIKKKQPKKGFKIESANSEKKGMNTR